MEVRAFLAGGIALAFLSALLPAGCATAPAPAGTASASRPGTSSGIPPLLRPDAPSPATVGRERAVRQQHPEWPDEIVRAVAKGEPVPGMTRDQAMAALGRGPYKVKREKTEEGEMEFWQVDWAYHSRRLLFRDGILLEVLPPTKLPPPKPSP